MTVQLFPVTSAQDAFALLTRMNAAKAKQVRETDCASCGSTNITFRDDSDPENGYNDPARPYCIDGRHWAD